MFSYLTQNCFQPIATHQTILNPFHEVPNHSDFYPNWISRLANLLPWGVLDELRDMRNLSDYKGPFHSFNTLLGLPAIIYCICELLEPKETTPLISEAIKENIRKQLEHSVNKRNYDAFYFDMCTILINYFRQTGCLDAYLLNIRNRIVLFASQKTNKDCGELATLLYHTSPIPFQFYGQSAKEEIWDEQTQPALERAFQTYYTPPRILTELINEMKLDLHQKTAYQGAQETPYTSTEQHDFMQFLSDLFDMRCDEASLMHTDKTDLNWLAISQLLLTTMVRKGYFRDFTSAFVEVKNTYNPTLDITWPEGLIHSPQDVSSLLPFLTNTLAGANALLKTQSQPISQAILYYFALLKNDQTSLTAFKAHYYAQPQKYSSILLDSDIPPFAEKHRQQRPFFLFCIQQLPIPTQITVVKPMISSIPIQILVRMLNSWPEAHQVAILTQPSQHFMRQSFRSRLSRVVDILMEHIKSFSPQSICQIVGIVKNTTTSPQTSFIELDWTQLTYYYNSEKDPSVIALLQGLGNLPPETKRAIFNYNQAPLSLLTFVLNHSPNQVFFDDIYKHNEDILSHQLQQLPPNFFELNPNGTLFYLNALIALSATEILPATFLPNLFLNPTALKNFFWTGSTKEEIHILQKTFLALAAENSTLFLAGLESDPDIFYDLLTHYQECDPEKLTRFFSMIPSKQLSLFLTQRPKQANGMSLLKKGMEYEITIKPILHALTTTLLHPEYFRLLFQFPHIVTRITTIKNTSLTYTFRQTILDFAEEEQGLFFQEMDKNPYYLLVLFLTHEEEGISRLFSKISPERKIQYLRSRDNSGLSLLDKALTCSQPATLSILKAMNTNLSGKDIRSILLNNECSTFKSIVKQPNVKIFNLLLSLLRKVSFTPSERHQLFLMALATQQDATRGFLFYVITEELRLCRGVEQNNKHTRRLFASIVEGHYLGTADIEDSYRQLIHIPHHKYFSFQQEVKFITYLESIKSEGPSDLYCSLFTSYLTYLRSSETTSHSLALIKRWNAALNEHFTETSSQYRTWINLRDELLPSSPLLAESASFFFRTSRMTTTQTNLDPGIEESKLPTLT